MNQIACLYEISQALSNLDLKNSLKKVLNILGNYMNIRRGAISIFDPQTAEIHIEVAYGLSAEARRRGRYRLGEGITGEVVATGRPIVVPIISQEPRFLNRTLSRSETEKKQTSFFCVPIKASEQVLGTLSIDKKFEGENTLEEDLKFLTVVAALVAQTVRNLLLFEAEKKRLEEENIKLKEKLQEKFKFSSNIIVGRSKVMEDVFRLIYQAAKSDATVLIRGESGTGKELVANAIHYNSTRASGPFIKINCAALPETLIESELFGHEKGAFSGAYTTKKGQFELADGGTIFLDEISELNLHLQAKLLRVLQEGEFYRVGGTKPIRVNIRIIAATNQNLEEAMKKNVFREDLYYRLNVFPIYLPPLRERRTDILLLAEHFLEEFNKKYNKQIRRISTPAIDLLVKYHWPGNVRELKNCIERAVIICDENVIRCYHLPPTLQTAESTQTQKGNSLKLAVENLEREMIIEALKVTKGNCSQAAKRLDTTLRILNYKIKKYGIDPSMFKIKI
ncbi:MAG TPA: nif-specific transcriptional activator NifA [Candidatus Desulfofervidus auxilii]|uniref:Nif-specific regulatory protein n=1 Tax=Desulfofervidus auxilii TaxID=1621989 RepID=A0A7C0YAD7_DESA2|nr:nif-specific transcriptional activator NifA [Candidatus Desulfofervidus auxilii]